MRCDLPQEEQQQSQKMQHKVQLCSGSTVVAEGVVEVGLASALRTMEEEDLTCCIGNGRSYLLKELENLNYGIYTSVCILGSFHTLHGIMTVTGREHNSKAGSTRAPLGSYLRRRKDRDSQIDWGLGEDNCNWSLKT